MAKKTAKTEIGTVVVKPARMARVICPIKGITPLVMNKFSAEAKKQMLEAMTIAKADKPTKKQRELRDVEKEYLEHQHISTQGWHGMPCGAFRRAMIDACRLVGVVMTMAKMTVFTISDGISADDGTPLIRIEGTPKMVQHYVRMANGSPNIAIRPMFDEWSAKVGIEFDLDFINLDSVINLLGRAGKQVGIGAGRPFSTMSAGMGWGTFEILYDELKSVGEVATK